MSHLPFLTPEANPDNILTDGTLDPDVLRSNKDRMTSGVSSTSATSNLARSMSTPDASSSRTRQALLFPVVAVISLGLSTALYSYVPELAGYELATISRTIDDPAEVGARVAWRLAEVGVAWFAGHDYWDSASLFLLYSAPYYFLLALFYEITPLSIFLSLAIELVTNVLPFVLLRPLSAHNAALRAPSGNTNASIAASFNIKAYVALFAAALYAVIVYTSLYTWLPVYLVVNFDSIRTLEHAHNAQLALLVAACIPLGIAAKDYLFVPSIFYARTTLARDFDAASASLVETFAYNFGLSGWGVREDVLVKRTALLIFMTFAVAIAKIWGTIEGAELWGALGWGGVFAAASLATGVGYAWVGDV